MTRQTQTVAFANFNLRFGQKFALLDMWPDIVAPALFKAPPRETKAGTFHITDVELVRLDAEVFVLGRLVKDTTLSRDQVFQNGELVPSRAEMDAAFSARFALRLSTHSLIWAPETKQAPSLASFHAAMSKSLGQHWKQHIDQVLKTEYPGHKRKDRKRLRLELVKRYPPPVLDIVAYPSEQSVSDFLSRIDLLTEIAYRIVDPNPHYDGAQTGGMLLGLKQEIRAKRAVVKLNDPDGLDHAAAAQQITELNSSGIIDTKVRGKGPNGEDITGDSEAMKVKVHVEALPDDNKRAAKILNDSLLQQEQSGVLKLGHVTDHARQAIAHIISANFPAGN